MSRSIWRSSAAVSLCSGDAIKLHLGSSHFSRLRSASNASGVRAKWSVAAGQIGLVDGRRQLLLPTCCLT